VDSCVFLGFFPLGRRGDIFSKKFLPTSLEERWVRIFQNEKILKIG
jgi:hypothetical protein